MRSPRRLSLKCSIRVVWAQVGSAISGLRRHRALASDLVASSGPTTDLATARDHHARRERAPDALLVACSTAGRRSDRRADG
jgi:hypothetical protein